MRNLHFTQSGQAFVFVVLILSMILIYAVLTLNGSVTFLQSTTYSTEKIQATQLAEAAIDKAVASLNANSGYGGEGNGSNGIPLGSGEYSITITNVNVSTYQVTATGYVPNKLKPKARKTVQIQISKGVGASFTYGMQVGNGGVNMGNSSQINGSIYSNGNFTGGNSNTVTGDVYVAGGTQPTADQQNDCTAPNCADYLFGRNVSGENRQDVAQSFQPSANMVLNRVSLRLKKIGSPTGNLTVRLMGDNGGNPNKNNVITSGTILNSSITSQYGWIDVTFGSTPNLNANTSYWIMIHANALDSSNYWVWSEDTLQTYTRGQPKWSVNWQAGSPVWTAIPGDLGFQAYMGGVATYIQLSNSSVIQGDAHANTLTGTYRINRNAYYQIISGVTVSGTSYPGSADPPPLAFPISDANIAQWKTDAQSAGVTTGNITSCPATLGPGKYVGNLTVGNSCTTTVKSPVWITGNFTTGNSPTFKLDPSFGASSGLIIVDGIVTMGNSPSFQGSGTAGSYMFLITTYDSRSNGTPAINIGNGSVTGVLYAPYGLVNLPNGSSLNELVAYQINMGNSTTLNYQTGLSNIFFSSGPQGSFTVIKGTYQSK